MQEVRTVEVRSRVGGVHGNSVGTLPLVVDLIELSVVEQVEHFPLEFKTCSFVDGESLERAEVEIQTPGIVQGISPDVAERETGRQPERSRIVDNRPADVGIFRLREAGARISDQIRTRTRTYSIAHTGVVAVRGSVRNRERQAGLGDRDARDLPSTQERVCKPGALEDRQPV